MLDQLSCFVSLDPWKICACESWGKGDVHMHTHGQTHMQLPKLDSVLLKKDFHLGSVHITCTLQIKGRGGSLVYGVKNPTGRMAIHKAA